MGNTLFLKSKVAPLNTVQPESRYAIGVIDVQNDFCKGGSLAINEADEILGDINKLIFATHKTCKIFHSQDYHTADHMSFACNHEGGEEFCSMELSLKMESGEKRTIMQTLWPKHCVQGEYGAQFHPALIITNKDKIVQKGTIKTVESYSAFGDAQGGIYEKTDLREWLDSNHITDIVLTGLATDYCVQFTALDALRLGYNVHLILSCTRGMNESTTKHAIAKMKMKGAKIYENVDEFIRGTTQIR